jgi:hypothetical protein
MVPVNLRLDQSHAGIKTVGRRPINIWRRHSSTFRNRLQNVVPRGPKPKLGMFEHCLYESLAHPSPKATSSIDSLVKPSVVRSSPLMHALIMKAVDRLDSALGDPATLNQGFQDGIVALGEYLIEGLLYIGAVDEN